jgi:DNA invertase Pin-like site-specific DNA recombinase
MTQQDHTNDTVPQSGRAAIYARPAAGARTQTTQQQTNTLIALANELGYPNERIILYEDVGVSARRPLVMRGALSDLLTAITQAEQEQEQERIRSVFVSSPYRLFRDPASVDIATFLHTCAEHNVSIVTPDMTFDLTDPAQIALFRSQCEAARQYITAQITRLNTGKRRKSQAGE